MVGNTFRLALALFLVASCGSSKRDVREARSSGYKVDFAVVYSQALAAVRELYPELVEDPKQGAIKTAWHPVKINQEISDSSNTRATQSGTANQPANSYGGNPRDRKFYFVRFDVRIAGGRPWRVHVKGESSSLKVGQVPTPLSGAEVPTWLEGRTDALRVAIHDRLRKHAVPAYDNVKPNSAPARVVEVKTEGLSGLPKAAADVIADVQGAAKARDVGGIRNHMASSFEFSPGAGAASPDVAVAVWQADPSVLGDMARVLETGCEALGETRVACPPPKRAEEMSFRAEFTRTKTGVWKMTSFYGVR